ncbi:MAG TPA: heme exporter protein CcmD [Holosporales bacterium]|nr:heme exporter protein CcmD [Holosporales bacterium]
MEPDLSDFYRHALNYDSYVGLAYGISLGVFGVLSMTILSKRRRLQKRLKSLEAQ